MGNEVEEVRRKIRKLGWKISPGSRVQRQMRLASPSEEKLNATAEYERVYRVAKDWRMDRYLRRLEAMLITANKDEILVLSGTGDVLEPDNHVAAIGSGSMYAQSAALALKKHAPHLTAEEMVRESLNIAADICIYTNHNILIGDIGRCRRQGNCRLSAFAYCISSRITNGLRCVCV